MQIDLNTAEAAKHLKETTIKLIEKNNKSLEVKAQ